MTHPNILLLIFSTFFIPFTSAQIPPVIPLTNALTAVYCHNLNDVGTMTIRCGANEKIRMLDAFDVVVLNRTHLPLQCLKRKPFSVVYGDISNDADCKVHTSFSSACSGRENCTLHMQRTRLNSVKQHCHNELVDYTMAFFECISDVFIHDICSTQAITSSWGTLKTPNFPNPYTSNEDCWCRLSTQIQHRLLLSVITFQLIPYDQQCAGAGLYLQSSRQQRSTQCTSLQPGHNYLSDTNSLYINFYSRTSTVRGGFWIIYEASHVNAEVHLRCGPREKIGPPSNRVPVSSPSPVSSAYNYGWSRLAYNYPPNPTTLPDINNRMTSRQLFATTPYPLRHKNWKMNVTTTAASAFTYPYGRLSTFDLEFGPRGWFVRHSYGSSNMTATKFLQATTTPSPVVKWNSTWLYIRRLRTRVPPTIIRTVTTTTTSTTTTTRSIETTTLELTTTMIPTSAFVWTTSEPITTTFPFSSTELLSDPPSSEISDGSVTTSASLEKATNPTIKSTIRLPISSTTLKTTVPFPTPWYPPSGPFDWWHWKEATTKLAKTSSTTTQTTSTSTQTTTTTTTTTTATTTTTTTTTTRTTSTTRSSTPKRILTLSNTTRQTTVTPKTETTVDWFQWPHTEPTHSTRGKPDYYDDEYFDWFDQLPTKKFPATSPTIPVLSMPQGKQYQQMSLLSTKSHWSMVDTDLTASTPSLSRTLSTKQTTDGTTYTNAQTSIQEPQKKDADEYSWLSKTDMTIVAVSILFVVLLVFINLILFAVRRHRHRIQNQHLLCASLPSSLNDRSISINQLHGSKLGDSTNSLINITNNNNSDILPAVGEIVLWDEKDQGGYMIDNHGEWAKIEGRQWLGSNVLKNQNKTSFSKSFRSRFPFIRQSNKKSTFRHPQAPLTPKTSQQQQQTSKFPLSMDSATLTPVPEADDYQSSDFSTTDIVNCNSHTKLRNSQRKHQQTTKTIQALIHDEQDHSDDYYKRIESGGDDSNYTTMHENHAGEYSIADQQTDRTLGNEINGGGSVFISVPTLLRPEDDIDITTDAAESIYNQNYAARPVNESTKLHTISAKACKQLMNHSITVGHCQADFQPLNPRLLEKSLLAEHQQFYTCSQSLQFSAYDSGFFEDQTTDSLVLTSKNEQTPSDEVSSNESVRSSLRGHCHLAKTYC